MRKDGINMNTEDSAH